MVDVLITIKNYRCFSDENPLSFNLRNGDTAFLGPNNSGKSSILKFFYESRPVWNYLLDIHNLDNLLRNNGNHSVGLLVDDGSDIFCRFNNRKINISVKIGNLELKFNIIESGGSSIGIEGCCFLISNNLLIPNGVDADEKYFLSDRGKIPLEEFFIVFKAISESVYIPSFRNIINLGENNRDYYDITVGKNFISNFMRWKLGNRTRISDIIIRTTNDIKNIFDYKSLELNPSENKEDILLIINNEKQYKLKEMGSGLTQFIMVFMTVALKNPSFILIDEPELNLHPTLQKKFISHLNSYSKNGILFATHSVGLARSMADQIYSVVKKDNSSIVKLFESMPKCAELLGELNFSTYQEMGISKVLLLEGPTEIKTFQQFLRKLDKEQEFLILPLGGNSMINGNREQELSDIKRITDKVYCWIDSEKESADKEMLNNRKEFLESCKKLDFQAQASERRAIENYFTERAIKRVRGENSRALDHYEKLNSSEENWSKSENWRIARFMEIDDIKNTDLGKFLLEL